MITIQICEQCRKPILPGTWEYIDPGQFCQCQPVSLTLISVRPVHEGKSWQHE